MGSPKLSIIIPVYNEEGTICQLLDLVAGVELPVDRELVIVNDGSSDRSAQLIKAWSAAHPETATQVFEQVNGGKGAAVRAGIARSTGDLVIIQDADLEYDPNDYRACIQPILDGRLQVVYGSRERFVGGHAHSSWLFYLGGILVSLWFTILYCRRLTDEPTCYKTFDGDLIRTLSFTGNGFEWEPEITARLLRLGVEIGEVPIRYRPRKVDQGKKIKAVDGFRAIWEAFRWRFRNIDEDRRRYHEWQQRHASGGTDPAA